MAKQYDVFILTINGKGYRVARDLAIGGRQVAWIDISELTSFQSKDLAGPFCASLPADVSDLYRREFLQDGDFTSLTQGFTLWHPEGVFEGQGEISNYQAQSLGQEKAIQFLQKLSTSNKGKVLDIDDRQFANNWVLFLAAYLEKAELEMSFSRLQENSNILPIFSETLLPEQDFSLRRKRQEELKVLGVDVLPVSDLQFRFEGEHYYFHLDGVGMVKGESFISFLSAWDLKQLDATFYKQVFANEPNESSHHWQRFEIHLESTVRLDQVPPWVLCLHDWDLPWVDANFYVLRRHRQDQDWSLWARVDSNKFAEAEYRGQLEKQLTRNINQRLQSQTVEVALPRDVDPLKMQWPVKAFPIYKNLKKQPKVIGTRFFACGPDSLGDFSSFQLHGRQKKIQQDIIAGDLL